MNYAEIQRARLSAIGIDHRHAALAAHEMVRGAHRLSFWTGVGLAALGLLASLIGAASGSPGPAAVAIGLAAAASGLAGLIAYEHAYVQAGQAVPLA